MPCFAVDEPDVVRPSRGLDPTLLGNFFSRRDSLEALGLETRAFRVASQWRILS